MSDGLRERLEHIVNGGQYTPADHLEAINALKEDYPHSISCLVSALFIPYNCYVYALGLVDSEFILQHVDMFRGVFIERLVNNGTLLPDEAGSVIVYFSEDNVCHAGHYEDGRVCSKWGIGCIWEHQIWEVPVSYGDAYRLFRLRPSSDIETEFATYYAELGAGPNDEPNGG